MKLYYSPGACSLAVHIALREIDRRFDLERVDLVTRRTARGADYLAINPKGYVPALELADGEVLTEAAVILSYLADLAPDSRLAPPSGTLARYRMEEWLVFLASEVHKNFSWLFYGAKHPREFPENWAKVVRGRLGERFLLLQNSVAEHAFLMGETFTIADAYLYAMLRWSERFGIELAIYPNLEDFRDRVERRPSVFAALEAEGLLRHTFLRSA